MRLNTLGLAHDFLRRYVPTGGTCIDATAGNGHDTALLCELVGTGGTVTALDIQAQAVDNTNARLQSMGLDSIGRAVLDSHAHLNQYAQPESVDAIVFNFGYLPGGDHTIFTQPESSIQAIEQGAELLKQGGVMCLSIYYGGQTGYGERDALLAHLQTMDPKRYTVLRNDFFNRPNDPPICVMIFKAT